MIHLAVTFLIHCFVVSSCHHFKRKCSVVVHLTQVERALDSAIIMKVFCVVLTVFLCISLIEAGRKKYGGGDENGSDNGNENLGNNISTSLMEGSTSVLGETNQRTAVDSINGII